MTTFEQLAAFAAASLAGGWITGLLLDFAGAIWRAHFHVTRW